MILLKLTKLEKDSRCSNINYFQILEIKSWKKIENDFANLSPVLKHIDLLEHKLRAKNFGIDNAVSIFLSRIN